jgi:hypothetical protein
MTVFVDKTQISGQLIRLSLIQISPLILSSSYSTLTALVDLIKHTKVPTHFEVTFRVAILTLNISCLVLSNTTTLY